MHIQLDNVSIRFPIYDAKQRSFKRQFLNVATGGRIVHGKHELTEVESLKNINLFLKEGERLALIGHNGSDPGVFTAMYFNPITKIGKIVLVNTDTDFTDNVWPEIEEIWKSLSDYENTISK